MKSDENFALNFLFLPCSKAAGFDLPNEQNFLILISKHSSAS